MEAIRSFDKPTCRKVSDAVMAALAETAKGFDLELRRGRGSYQSEEFTIKLVLTTRTEDGVINTPARRDYVEFAKGFPYDLPPDTLDTEFECDGSTYTITGLKLRNRKYPIAATRVSDGKTFKFGAETVRRALAAKLIRERAAGAGS